MKPFFSTIICWIFLTSNAFAGQLFRPYFDESPTLETFSDTYCETSAEELFFWRKINRYANSALKVFPRLPPDERAYLQGERASGDLDRSMNAYMNPAYRLQEVIGTATQVAKTSETFLKAPELLTLKNKVLIAAITLKAIRNEDLNRDAVNGTINYFQKKGITLDEENLRAFIATNYFLEITLINYLQCLGHSSAN